jgi:hypothetical protein
VMMKLYEKSGSPGSAPEGDAPGPRVEEVD